MSENLVSDDGAYEKEDSFQTGKPLEPEGGKGGTISRLKWIFFAFVVIYSLLSYLHAPILTCLGEYLIVKHSPQESDLIVCLAGGNVDRGLTTADAFQKGLAPCIFMAREEPDDGYDQLREKRIDYPDSVDLMVMLLEQLGISRSVFLTSDRAVNSTFDEAEYIRDLIAERGDKSIILITSPVHSRRAWLTFKKVFEETDVRILVLPSSYSEFNPEDWWTQRKYVREVIIEYQKLIYYAFKYFL
jgi:uncharacterized SAM-binding protein YcdF (DUF218 family)